MSNRSAGRPAGPSTARQDILDAAVHLFAERGYDRTTLRAVTDTAGVDVALVKHYFGGKEGLFDEAVTRHADQSFALLDRLQDPTPPDARTVAGAYLRIWETEKTANVVKALFRSALESEERREKLQELVAERLAATGERNTPDDTRRVQLLSAHLMGVGIVRYLLKFSPVTDLTHEEMVADLAPVIERYLP
ncbi:TetR/AcrR family transcriptional regulator [Corynebacterium variabile]|uniref:TetR/AcrR family transcriptional regulator n=1 Tax=Corynebacterium variabile TaxID=1727 RepID=UPI001E0E1534|nr:TetR family transcriptional regulator [Corynebacterium variabile]HJG45800.1 TetR family transcriptional regulator [Corynebacterium variabile]